MPNNGDALWYKDAIIYQLHVKAFSDSNNDGVGDFRGLLQKLDYLRSLGITCVWLLPFYPSPQKDDGYDIAEYRSINPSYGTMRDFRAFVREAHDRDIRIIIELVINHTSDQHPWFQRARHAKPGSKLRDWYVWSDTDQKYAGTRIIFTDTEPSNWAWDPVAKSYYWHRFFSHQPDLNFDNPQVMRAVVNVMNYWLDMGVDGMRLDAIPYLVEREGTNNENLAETHTVLKNLRAEQDKRYPDRMLLAEANQWPEDVQQYFGAGDECHMAYHFPLMPRMYMAIAQEDRHPITDILRQTPEIPAQCQWAIFLRNHDELTLEMVTDSERDYLWNTYAADRRARLNLGIRRRLAPLMEGDRRKIELMNSLLMSLPGTPIVYYGDEIGMGDNIFLGDRNGVRTPMQWTPDRNGGFSRGDPAGLYLPPLMDPVYGYQAVNVEAQTGNQSSLLNWMRRLITVRQSTKVFGRGKLTFLYPSNRRVLAYLRQHEQETVLCVANLARSPQSFSLDLTAFKASVPVEMFGRAAFPLISEAPYELSLPGHSFYWFALENPETRRIADIQLVAPEYITLVWSGAWADLLRGSVGQLFLQEVLPSHLPRQRWFRAKDALIRSVTPCAAIEFKGEAGSWLITILETKFVGNAPPQRYLLPLAQDGRELRLLPPPVQARAIAKTRKGSKEGALFDAIADDRFVQTLVKNLRAAVEIEADGQRLRFLPTAAMANVADPSEFATRQLGADQSNSSVLVSATLILKLYRQVEPGRHPEIEFGRYLTEFAKYANTPPMLGAIELSPPKGQSTALGIAHAFVRNQGDGWEFTVKYLDRFLDESAVLPVEQIPAADVAHTVYLTQMRQLGRRVAELHMALCRDDAEPAFRPEPASAGDVTNWVRSVRNDAKSALAALRAALPKLSTDGVQLAAILVDDRQDILKRIDALAGNADSLVMTRIHGDLHLGQVMVAQNDFYVIDFEGEPRRPLAERHRKDCPLRDVAGVLRSFDYAAWTALENLKGTRAGRRAALREHALAWRDRATDAFLSSYRQAIGTTPSYPQKSATADALLQLFLLGKVFYEIHYELTNRPLWVETPLRGAVGILYPDKLI